MSAHDTIDAVRPVDSVESPSPMISIHGLGKRYRIPASGKGQAQESRWQRLAKGITLGELLSFGSESHSGMRELWALKDVTFDVAPGTVVGLIGPNGAGKSTLLKVLARVTAPTEGRVLGRGRVVSLIELGAGFDPETSARENVFLNAALYGIPRYEVEEHLDEIIEFAEMGEFAEMPLKHFSSGMYLRLAFSVAINMNPDILLADEILAVGDETFQTRCLQRVAEEGRRGLTVLFVSHDMDAISRICSRVIWLAGGKVVRDGDPDEVIAEYQNAAWDAGMVRPGGHGMHACRYGEILDVRLVTPSGREIGAVPQRDDVRVRVRFKIGPAKVKVQCGIDLYSRGLHVLRSTQSGFTKVDPDGMYETFLHLPGSLLAETMYSITTNLLLVRGRGEEHSLQMAAALKFMVYGEHRKGDAVRRGTSGLIAPSLEWANVRPQAGGPGRAEADDGELLDGGVGRGGAEPE